MPFRSLLIRVMKPKHMKALLLFLFICKIKAGITVKSNTNCSKLQTHFTFPVYLSRHSSLFFLVRTKNEYKEYYNRSHVIIVCNILHESEARVRVLSEAVFDLNNFIYRLYYLEHEAQSRRSARKEWKPRTLGKAFPWDRFTSTNLCFKLKTFWSFIFLTERRCSIERPNTKRIKL